MIINRLVFFEQTGNLNTNWTVNFRDGKSYFSIGNDDRAGIEFETDIEGFAFRVLIGELDKKIGELKNRIEDL